MSAPASFRVHAFLGTAAVRDVEISRGAFALAWLEDRERAQLESRHAQSVAGAVALKRAIGELLATLCPGAEMGPREIVLGHDEAGRPTVEALPARAREALALSSGRILVSISHSRSTAWGLALLEVPS